MKTQRILLASISSLLCLGSAHAATFTWDGTTNLWNSAHWNPGPTAGPTGSSNANSAIINGGTVSFAGNDTFGDANTTSSAVLTVNSGGTLASGGFFNTIWNLNLNSGTVALTGGVNASYPAFQFAGTLTATGTSNINVVSGANNFINIGGSGNNTLTMNVVNASDALNVNAPLQNNPSGASSLTKTGLGTLTLSGANAYTGGTTVNGGTLSLAASGALPSGGGVTIGAGGRLSNAAPAGTSFALNGLTLTGGELAATSTPDVSLGNFYLNGNVTVGGSARSTISADLRVISNQTRDFNVGVTGDPSGVDLLISGALSHQNNVAWGYGTKSGAGVMKLSGLNGLGGMTVSAGRFILEDNAIGWTYPVNGLVNNSQLEFSVTSGSRSYEAILGGSGALFKTGAGTMILTRANTYAGATTINGGTLELNNTIGTIFYVGGTISINNGSTLRLSGGNQYWFDGKTVAFGAGGGTFDTGTNMNFVTGASGLLFTTTAGTTSTIGGSSGINLNGATDTFDVATNSTLNLTTFLWNGGNVIKQGGGTLTLTGANTYLGTTTISAGTLQIGAAGTAGSITSTSNVVNNGALVFNRTDTYGGNFTKVISGSGSLTLANGTLTLTAANSYTGATTVSGGTLVLQNTYASSGFAIGSGNTLELNVASGTRDLATTTFSGVGTLSKTGTSEVRWGAGAATFALGSGSLIDVQGGNFVGGSNANEVWTANLSNLNVASGAFFSGVEANVRVNALTGAGTISSGFGGAGYVNFTFGVNNGSGTFSGVLANGVTTGNFVKQGSGTQILTGANTFTGTTTISGGTLQIGNGGATGSLYSPTAAFGNLTFGSTGAIVDNSALVYNIAGGALNVNRSISGTGTVNVTGNQSVNFADGTVINTTGSQTYSATATSGRYFGFNLTDNATVALTSTAGNISMTGMVGTANGSNGVLNLNTSAGNGNITLNVATGVSNVDFNLNNLTLNAGTGTVTLGNFSGSQLFNGPSTALTITAGTLTSTATIGTGSVNITNSLASTMSGVFSGGGSLTKSGAGTLTLSAVETYTGATVVNQGVLQLNAGNQSASGLYASSGITINNGGQILVSNDNSLHGFSGTAAGAITINAGGSMTTADGLAVHIRSAVILNGGTLASGTPNLTFGSWALFGDVTATGTTASTISATNMYLDVVRTFTVSDAAGNLNVTGDFTGVALTKSGAGTMTLSGANTYTGATAVSGGTLAVSGSISGTSSLSLTAGTLLLTGSAASGAASNRINDAASVTLNGGGLKVDNTFTSAFNETFGALTLSSASTLDFGASPTTAVHLTFDFGSTTFAGHYTGGTLNIANWTGTENVAGGEDQLIFTNLTSAPDQSFLNAITFGGHGPGAAAIAFGANSYEIVAVPEPSSTALIGAAALLGLVGFRERRRLLGARRVHSGGK